MKNLSVISGGRKTAGLFRAFLKLSIQYLALSTFLMMLCAAVGRGQNFTYKFNSEYGNVEHNTAINHTDEGSMWQYKVADDSHFSNVGTEDPRVTISADKVAANGYGQWTISTAFGMNVEPISGTQTWICSPDQDEVAGGGGNWNPNGNAGWALLGNMIGMPSEKFLTNDQTHHPGVQPPGVVSLGKFQFFYSAFDVAHSQIAANLNGNVRYVCIAPGGNAFIIEGFDDERGTGQQIDISLSDPHLPADRQVVRNRISALSVPVPLNSHGVSTTVISSEKSDDKFHIAIDSKFLYITWCTSAGNNNGANDVWAMAVNLANGTSQTVLVGAGGGGNQCMRPTVAADLRGPYSGNSEFTVAYLVCNMFLNPGTNTWMYPPPPPPPANPTGLGFVHATQFIAMVATNKNSALPQCMLGLSTCACVQGDITAYTEPTHARILASSVAGITNTSYSVYVLVTPLNGVGNLPLNITLDYHLIFYDNIQFNLNDKAFYVDGLWNAGSYPAPMSSMAPSQTPYSMVGIVDAPIVASVNPYDNQDYDGTPDHLFKQIHCLYQPYYRSNATSNPPDLMPLQLIQKFNNGLATNNNCATQDTRILLNQDIGPNGLMVVGNPSSYCMAINQMGIHIHWHANDPLAGNSLTHYYVRDVRAFDEDIEENTLITNVCYIADGSAHGGTAGANITGLSGARLLASGRQEDNRKIALWTDPNYGLNVSDGLWYKSNYTSITQYAAANSPLNKLNNIATLKFLGGNNISLEFICDAMPVFFPPNPPAYLFLRGSFYTSPNCSIQFQTDGQLIKIVGTSTWDFFGTSQTNCFSGSGMVDLEGVEQTIPYPPESPWVNIIGLGHLNIHPGGQFNGVPITMNLGDIEVQHGPNIYPLGATHASSPNSPANGLLMLDRNNNVFTNYSQVNSYCISGTTPTVMLIKGTGSGTNASDVSLSSTNTAYNNQDQGVGIIQYNILGNAGQSPDAVTFNSGAFSSMRFLAYDPQLGDLTLQNLTFDKFSGREIDIERQNYFSNSYGNITVSNNTFLNFLNTGGNTADQYGIFLSEFNKSGLEGKIDVSSNSFHWFNFNTTANAATAHAAIGLKNVTGDITDNYVNDPNFEVGIELGSSENTTDARGHKAYLCSNTVLGIYFYSTDYLWADPITHKNLIETIPIGTGIFLKGSYYRGAIKSCHLLACGTGIKQEDNGINPDYPLIAFTNIDGSVPLYTIDGGRSYVTYATFGTANIGLSLSFWGFADMSGIHGGPNNDDIAAFNSIGNTTTDGIYIKGQVLQWPPVLLGNTNSLLSTNWQNFGKNNLGGGGLLIFSDQTPSDLGNIDNNWWFGLNPNNFAVSPCDGAWGGGFTTYASGITYGNGTTAAGAENCMAVVAPTAIAPGFSVTCHGGYRDIGDSTIFRKVTQPLSVDTNFDTVDCKKLFGRIMYFSQQQQYQQEYDSGKKFFGTCYDYPGSGLLFNFVGEGLANIHLQDTSRFRYYRYWLISVLLLNRTDPYYFCFCMMEISATYLYSEHVRFPNAKSTIYRWMLNHHYCPDNNWHQLDSEAMAGNYLEWQDGGTGNFDSTLNTMHELGLDFLDTLQAYVDPQKTLYLASFTSSPNPFSTQTSLDFTLARMTYVQLAIYDELGRLVWGEGRGSSLEAGAHRIQIDGTKLPSGTFYARISTGFGEVKTLKLVHEK